MRLGPTALLTTTQGLTRILVRMDDDVVLKAALSGEQSDAPAGTIGRRDGADVLVAARDQWIRVRRVQAGSTSYPAADVLRSGERFALPVQREASAAVQ
jgi:hypothetical protein